MTTLSPRYVQEVENYLANWSTQMDAIGTELGAHGFTRPLHELAGGGKRLRARFLSAGWRLAGGGELAPTEVIGGAAVELFQLAALVHDDLIDNSDRRRGFWAAHKQYEQELSSRSTAYDQRRFGVAGAVLLGDLLTVQASTVFERALVTLDSNVGVAARNHFQEMMTEVTFGQFLDTESQFRAFGSDFDAEIASSWQVLRHKSARYSIEHPLTLGALMAGADSELLSDLAAAGLAIGEAFQLRDDILGVYGDPEQTGKPAGDDIREGKRTILILQAAKRAESDDFAHLSRLLGSAALSADQVTWARALIQTTGALEHVEDLIESRLTDALEVLEPYTGREHAQVLFELAKVASHRTV